MATFLQQLINGIAWGSIYALIALGYTMVYGVLRMINFAHGDVAMVGAMLGIALVNWIAPLLGVVDPNAGSAMTFLLTMPIAMLACALIGITIEFLAYRPLRASPRITVLITAIGVSLLLEYGGQALVGAKPLFFPRLVGKGSWTAFEGRLVVSYIDLITVSVSLALMVALQFVVFRTKVGTAMRAVAFNHDAARLMGVNVNGIITFTFALGSALAAAAGILLAVKVQKVEPLMGLMPGLKAFVAAVLGGIGNIPGAVAGGIVLGVTEAMVIGYGDSTYKDATAFVVLILILLFRPAGLFGVAATEKV